jgi:hypothetical protein
MSTETYISIRYDSKTERYLAELFVGITARDWKWLTVDEAEALSSYTQFLDTDEDLRDIPVAEILEQVESGDILLDEESNLLAMIQEVTK